MTEIALEDIRSFQVADQWEILVGKTARANDHLSLKVAKPGDFWFHVAGMPGSHVVARHPSQPQQCPRDVKRAAAGLAAYFSKAKNAGKTAVHWTTCKHVSKGRGQKPGQVLLRRFEAISIQPLDPSQMARDLVG